MVGANLRPRLGPAPFLTIAGQFAPQVETPHVGTGAVAYGGEWQPDFRLPAMLGADCLHVPDAVPLDVKRRVVGHAGVVLDSVGIRPKHIPVPVVVHRVDGKKKRVVIEGHLVPFHHAGHDFFGLGVVGDDAEVNTVLIVNHHEFSLLCHGHTLPRFVLLHVAAGLHRADPDRFIEMPVQLDFFRGELRLGGWLGRSI